MGFNISGFTIDKNYEEAITELESILGEKLILDGEVNFEQASENWKEDTYCDIYFGEKGTLVFFGMEKASSVFKARSRKTLSFILSEISMTFAINYTENNALIRGFIETEDGQKQEETGDLLEFEEQESDTSELIFHLISETIDQPFWEIEPEEKSRKHS